MCYYDFFSAIAVCLPWTSLLRFSRCLCSSSSIFNRCILAGRVGVTLSWLSVCARVGPADGLKSIWLSIAAVFSRYALPVAVLGAARGPRPCHRELHAWEKPLFSWRWMVWQKLERHSCIATGLIRPWEMPGPQPRRFLRPDNKDGGAGGDKQSAEVLTVADHLAASWLPTGSSTSRVLAMLPATRWSCKNCLAFVSLYSFCNCFSSIVDTVAIDSVAAVPFHRATSVQTDRPALISARLGPNRIQRFALLSI